MPFNMEEVRGQINAQGGLEESLNMFLLQEVDALQSVILRTRKDLQELQMALDGDIVMTHELHDAMMDVYDGKVPKLWVFTVGGDEFSWISNSWTVGRVVAATPQAVSLMAGGRKAKLILVLRLQIS